uniref:Cleft lip and palate transmembrane protein 1 homolog n=1 Tax=Steinernema glaseri TaxID=37863 RepID=A0A1I8A149_9BILA
MADNSAVAPAGGGADVAAEGNAQQPQQSFFATIKGIAVRMVMMYAFMSFMRSMSGQQGGANNNTAAPATGKAFPPARNIFAPGQLFDFHMYISESNARFEDFDRSESLLWKETNLVYGDWTSGPNGDGSMVKTITFPTPEVLLRNGSLYLHVFVTKHGKTHNNKLKGYSRGEVIYESYQLNKYKKKFYKKTVNLLTGKSEQSEEDLAKAEVVKYEVLNFWHPNITVNLVADQTQWTKGQLPSPLDESVKFDQTALNYKPILFFNNYWNLGSEYIPINDTVKEVNLTLTYAPLSLFKWQLYASQQMRSKWSQMLGGEIMEEGDDDQDTIKQALLETSPYLLAITVIVSILHTVFEFLAFKNDIQFWRSRRSLEGLSVRSVLFNIFQSGVVFLYICDNDTSWVVKMSVGVGLLIEMWKIPKCLNVNIDYENKILGIVPKVTFSDKGSYVQSATKEYDQLAFKYLSWVLYPLLAGYAVYSLMYVEQRGWYSWVLNMLYSFLLTFGFIMMTPQLFINYKLKSVAHLPWRMLSYKFINTFIDDLFAFVIRMPTMYRLGCFRDDIIFLIYLYQRWIYRVDPTRVNEFGTSMEDPTGANQQDDTLAVEGAASPDSETKKAGEDESKKDK